MTKLRLSIILLFLCIAVSIARTQTASSQEMSVFDWETVPKTTARDLLIQKFKMGPKWLVDPVAFAEMIPPDAELSFLSGMSLKRRNQHQAAVKRYAEIIATHPDCYPAYLCEGISCGSLQEYATARTLFQEAEKLRPDISAAYEQEGWCFYREHNLKRAVQCFDKAIKISPLPSTYVWLATCYQDMRKPREMMELFKKSVNFPDTTGYTDLALAQVALHQDHVDDALSHIHDALQKAPNDSLMYAFKAACLFRQKKLDEALELYQHAALIDPYQPAYQDYIAQLLSQMSRHDEAIAHFRKAIEMDQLRAATYAHEGKCLEDLHNYDEAMKLYKKAIELEPKNANWQRYAADCLYAQENFDDAATYYQEAARLDPKDYSSLHNLAWCYQFTDRENDAKRARRQSKRVPGEKEAMRKAVEELRAKLAIPDASSPRTDTSPIMLHPDR